MRPKNLKFPFKWEERRPLFFNGVFVVPQCYEEHARFVDQEGLFSSKEGLSIEFCSGNGDWVIAQAKKEPNTTWIAVEKDFERVRKIWSKMHNEGIKNLLIVSGEALTFTTHYLLPDSVARVHVNFPDPWPKLRHAKHRLIQRPFVDALARVIQKGGKAFFATDDPPYCAQMIREMTGHPSWAATMPPPHYVQKWEDYGDSWFATLWEKLGRDFHYMEFERQ